ncbi:MAG: hypothetical protein R2764_12625 [Bacteroidales bacterium]
MTTRFYGMDPSAFYPQHIRLYGGVTGMLPESNISGRIDDLKELAIEVVMKMMGFLTKMITLFSI